MHAAVMWAAMTAMGGWPARGGSSAGGPSAGPVAPAVAAGARKTRVVPRLAAASRSPQAP